MLNRLSIDARVRQYVFVCDVVCATKKSNEVVSLAKVMTLIRRDTHRDRVLRTVTETASDSKSKRTG